MGAEVDLHLYNPRGRPDRVRELADTRLNQLMNLAASHQLGTELVFWILHCDLHL